MKFKVYTIEELKKKETEHIIDTTIMMAYNPSIARIFSTEINKQNKRIIRKFIPCGVRLKNRNYNLQESSGKLGAATICLLEGSKFEIPF